MALIRTSERIFNAGRALRRGEFMPYTVDDVSALSAPNPRDTGDGNPDLLRRCLVEGDLLAFRWQPLAPYLAALAVFGMVSGVGSAYLYFAGQGSGWGWQALATWTLGPLLIWYAIFAPSLRLVIFDRRRGLVHLPRWFRMKRYDAVRFADLDVLLAKLPEGFGGYRVADALFVAWPGWNLWRGQFPPWYRRICLDMDHNDGPKAERLWRELILYMTEASWAEDWVEHRRWSDKVSTKHNYEGNWLALRRDLKRHIRILYGSQLLTRPNWLRDEQGNWYRDPSAEQYRERIDGAQGPGDVRVPV